MNFKIEKLIIQNFLSIGNIELQFCDNGSTLIQGIVEGSSASDSNGSGKSSIIDALIWVLFDKTLRGISKDDIVNNVTNKDCFVKLIGKVEKDSIEIIRYRKHKEFKNQIKVIYNEQDISDSIDSKTNKKIIEIIKMDFDDFQANIIFSNNSVKFLELGDVDRKKVFDSIVKSDLYEKCIEITKQKIKDIDDVYNKQNQSFLICESNKNIYDKSLKQIKESILSFEKEKEKNINTIISKINELNNKISEIKCDVIESMDDLKQLKHNKEQEIFSIAGKQVELNNCHILKQLQSEHDSINSKLNDLRIESTERQSKLKELNKDSENIKNNIDKISTRKQSFEENLKLNRCSACGQQLLSTISICDLIKDLEKEINDNKREFDEIEIDKKEVQCELNEIVLKAKELKVNIEEIKFKLDKRKHELNDETTNILEDINRIKEYIKLIDEKIKKIENHNNLISINKTLIEVETRRLDDEKNKENPYILQEKNTIDNLNNEIKKMDELNSSLVKILKKNENHKYWLNGFKKIKGLLISTITPIMNEKAIEYSNIFTSGEFSINFVTQRENKDGSIKDVFDIEVNRKNGGCKYEALSAGEKRRVDLIVMFVLDDLKHLNCMHSINIRFYDEIFDSLDELGIEKVIDILKHISTNKQVFVISHKNDLKDLFSDCLTVVKKDGISSILEKKRL